MKSFLARNIKLLIHIRKRLHVDQMLGLCLGAGVSVDFQFPKWPELVQRIAAHPEVEGQGLLDLSESLTSQSQFLFQMYRQRLEAKGLQSGDAVADARQANLGWLKIVHGCLYDGAATNDKELKEHPYLWSLVPLIKKSAMTVNYNFDDTVERMLYSFYSDEIKKADDRGFEVVWRPAAQFRRRQGVIYHPNGYLPLNTSDGMSEQIIFMEEEYADQLIEAGTGHYACLLDHLTKQSLIFIGLSLSDTTLKHILRVAARINPGNFHYHVHWCRDSKPTPDEQRAISDANFSVYNLVTLFLTTEEIKELAQLIVADSDSFNAKCDEESLGVTTEYRYYLTGAVGSGKTSAVEQLRCIDCFDEWVDRKHSLLHRPHEELDSNQRKEVDLWINQQFRKKNRRVSQAMQTIALVDRSPLDPLYFAEDEAAIRLRAVELLQSMVPGMGTVRSIASGHLIILTCDVAVLRTRLASRDKRYADAQIRAHQERIEKFWDSFPQARRIDTTNMTMSQVVKEILREILFADYREMDFHGICASYGE